MIITPTLNLSDKTLHMERVSYADINVHDTIVHIHHAERDESIFVCVGVASEKSRFGEWFGDGRRTITVSYMGEEELRGTDAYDNRVGIVIAAEWHDDEEDGHTLWRVVHEGKVSGDVRRKQKDHKYLTFS